MRLSRHIAALLTALLLLVTAAPTPSMAAAPNTSITSGPSGTRYTSFAKFSFTSSISGSSFQCKLDGGSWQSCSSPKSYTVAYRSHTFYVRAIKSGVADSTPAYRTWTAKPPVTISLNCTSDPELTGIKNANPNASVVIKTVGSIYQPRTNEPFYVSKTLAIGGGITYKTGNAAIAGASTTLTRSPIYQNDVGSQEGARVVTSAGTVVKRCP